jgi:hypothetical protein
MVEQWGIERLGMLTITFKENLVDWDEAERRFHSFEKNVLSQYCTDWAAVVQVQKRGAIHYHLLTALREDIKTGTNLEVIKNRDLPAYLRYGANVVSPNLRRYWNEICARARGDKEWKGGGYGIGRIELLPIYTCAEQAANYLTNYLAIDAEIEARYKKKKKLRFSRTITAWLGSSFQRNTFGAFVWRKKLEVVASEFNLGDYGDLADYFGPNWFWILRDAVRSCPLCLDKNEWQQGRGQRLFERWSVETYDGQMEAARRGQCGVEWREYREALTEAWRRFQEFLREYGVEPPQLKADADPWKAPKEWQLQLLLMNWDIPNDDPF